ncbi:DUF1289 domain-containing protein [Shewanella hanedai]|uniref:DUF1289 domain-containing protein n=1 Tax=Shewanella hanedai TaxID=25 RepID=A0A553JPS3_SHEHA|nr:DUF1289 domain-containing protein [Shewanella hanedai]TRY14467.1 DUF1289 domain-containing protein [Shewanella hanedai]GGI78731.1 DUF1289 domain-containing protein [Shewanella hanedai]
MIHSPCVAKCGLNDEDICMGCYRNIDEIVEWGNADDAFKTKVLELIPARKIALGKGENCLKLTRDKWIETEARLQGDTEEV